jgi:hypothetical protein
MLEIYEKINGEYTNKSIKLNDLGMNQSIEFTPKFMATGEGQYGAWFKVTGIYHSEEGDKDDITLWAGKGYFPKFELQADKRCTVTKFKKDGAKFHTYNVEPVSTGSSLSSPSLSLPGAKFDFKLDDLKDGTKVYSDKDMIDFIKVNGKENDESTYKEMWVKYGSTESRATLVFKNRGN